MPEGWEGEMRAGTPVGLFLGGMIGVLLGVLVGWMPAISTGFSSARAA